MGTLNHFHVLQELQGVHIVDCGPAIPSESLPLPWMNISICCLCVSWCWLSGRLNESKSLITPYVCAGTASLPPRPSIRISLTQKETNGCHFSMSSPQMAHHHIKPVSKHQMAVNTRRAMRIYVISVWGSHNESENWQIVVCSQKTCSVILPLSYFLCHWTLPKVIRLMWALVSQLWALACSDHVWGMVFICTLINLHIHIPVYPINKITCFWLLVLICAGAVAVYFLLHKHKQQFLFKFF